MSKPDINPVFHVDYIEPEDPLGSPAVEVVHLKTGETRIYRGPFEALRLIGRRRFNAGAIGVGSAFSSLLSIASSYIILNTDQSSFEFPLPAFYTVAAAAATSITHFYKSWAIRKEQRDVKQFILAQYNVNASIEV